ncbi:MAG: formimidoylglutamase [Marinoscillum sp.]
MYRKPEKSNWSGRIDPNKGKDALLWHQVIECISLDDLPPAKNKCQPILLGFKSDEGVKRNMGRIGAADGPDAMRKAMSGFALHFDADQYPLIDCGDVVASDGDLNGAHQELAQAVTGLLSKKYLPIVMGGGHEISYGHYCGISDFTDRDKVIGIINLDAHFDLRPYAEGAHSGSPFRQILDDCRKHKREFHYFPIGINPAGNQQSLFKVLDEARQTFIVQDQIRWDNMAVIKDQILTFADDVDHIYLTLDLDVMPAAHAPGVSAPAAFGVDPNHIREMIRVVFSTNKVISFDIAELNPTYDDGRTAKLAGSFIYDLIAQYHI